LVTKSTVKVVKAPGKYTYTVDVAVTTPNFPTSTPEPVYTIEYKTQEAGSTWMPWSGSPRVVTYGDGYVRIAETRIMTTSNFKPYDFRVAVTGVTPSGYQGGTALPALYTNIGRMPLTIALSPALNTLFPVWGQ